MEALGRAKNNDVVPMFDQFVNIGTLVGVRIRLRYKEPVKVFTNERA